MRTSDWLRASGRPSTAIAFATLKGFSCLDTDFLDFIDGHIVQKFFKNKERTGENLEVYYDGRNWVYRIEVKQGE